MNLVRSQELALSVCICAHNRSDNLARCLEALKGQCRDIQLIIVDSASGDIHEAEIRNLASLHRANLIRLNQPGLSAARNAALSATTTSWIAYLDDDTIPSEQWVDAAIRVISEVPSDCSIIGGRIVPLFPPDGTSSIGPRWLQLLSVVDMNGEGDQTDRPHIVGANVLFRVQTIRQAGGFPLSLGRSGTSLLSGEEKFIVEHLRSNGQRIWYSETLSVQHHIAPQRLLRSWVIRRSYWEGASDRRIDALLGRRPSIGRFLKILFAVPILALLYPIGGHREFFIRFWYNVGWLASGKSSLLGKDRQLG